MQNKNRGTELHTLIIVESPVKAKKLQGFLGRDYTVLASMGHIRDLPTKSMGVEKPDYKPQYQPTEKGSEVITRLKQAAQRSDKIVLATDPDREGEAIAWHLFDALGLSASNTVRVTYNAVTEEAVLAALKKPRKIDMDLVRAQEARRVLDRLVGYRLSFPVSDAVKDKASAGRVQTPAVRIIVERDDAIANFKPTNHFGVTLMAKEGYALEWQTAPFVSETFPFVLDRNLAEAAASHKTLTVEASESKVANRRPPPPFTTSTMQQEASTKLKMPSATCMSAAQKLFEEGLITYHRTDSVVIEPEAIDDIRAYAKAKGLPLPDKPQKHVTKGANAQEAHEAIRPTHMDNVNPPITGNLLDLYRLIHAQALTSQLADKVERVSTIKAYGMAGEIRHDFLARAVQTIAPGYTVITKEEGKADSVPELKPGSVITIDGGEVVAKKTKAPSRFNEGTLIKELTRLEIGRPSTWSAIIENIKQKNFIVTDKSGWISSTDLGRRVIETVSKTKFASLDFTSAMEKQLDLIASGKSNYQTVISKMDSIIDSDLSIIKDSA